MKHELPSELDGADWLLIQWALWVFSDPAGPNCSSSCYGPGEGAGTVLTDDQGMAVDKAIAGMEKTLKRAIKWHYLSRLEVTEAVLWRAIRVFDQRFANEAGLSCRYLATAGADA